MNGLPPKNLDPTRDTATEAALEALHQLESHSDRFTLASYLVQFLRHPSPQVRSKATLLLGRANLNLTRVRTFLEASDARVRANAVESLWAHSDQESVQRLLWEATRDSNGRVAINALVGLCNAGDRRAFARLDELASSPDPVLRSGAAWAMGEMATKEFDAALEKLEHDGEEKVRSMATRSRKRLKPRQERAQPKQENASGLSQANR